MSSSSRLLINAEHLAAARRNAMLSQEELALMAGLAGDTVSRLERGERDAVRPRTIRGLAAALGVDNDYLVLAPGDAPSKV